MYKKFILGAIIILSFITIYPILDWNISCPSETIDPTGFQRCMEIRTILWEIVAMFSFYSSDGLSLTAIICDCDGSPDEANYKSIVIVSFSILVATLVKANMVISNLENRSIKKIKDIVRNMDEIFVFGSNLLGRHDGGAAAFALENCGAVYGQGIGIQGNSYAIPTMDEKFQSLPLDVIKVHIQEFLLFAKEHEEINFYVTPVGCGIAGFTPEEIAPLFIGFTKNIRLDDKLLDVLKK